MEDDKGWPMTDADNRKKMDHTATIRYTYTDARASNGGGGLIDIKRLAVIPPHRSCMYSELSTGNMTEKWSCQNAT